MKIFLSWSGERSMRAASELREWVPLVFHDSSPWFSDLDISAGKRWSPELAGMLAEASCGILCITRDNVRAPWLLFEAGALAGTLSKADPPGAVLPYLLDVDLELDPKDPLAQFQAKKANRVGTFDLVKSLNEVAKIPIEPGRLRDVFEALWPRLKERLDALPPSSSELQSKGQDAMALLVRIEARLAKLEERPESSFNPREKPPLWAVSASDSNAEAAVSPVAQEEARRLAQLLIAEIELYHGEDVEEGRQNRDLLVRLGKEIEEARLKYNQIVSEALRARADFFQEELTRILAAGDETLVLRSGSDRAREE